MEQMLSSPPQATRLPVGAYAQVITHDERRGIACTFQKEGGKADYCFIFVRQSDEPCVPCAMYLVAAVGVPDDELAVLRGRHDMLAVR